MTMSLSPKLDTGSLKAMIIAVDERFTLRSGGQVLGKLNEQVLFAPTTKRGGWVLTRSDRDDSKEGSNTTSKKMHTDSHTDVACGCEIDRVRSNRD
jgi:hypothetical protein